MWNKKVQLYKSNGQDLKMYYIHVKHVLRQEECTS